jgi:type IV pilus assembly protein PilN
MWFTRLEEKGMTIKIDGIALDNKTVADFMVGLQQSGLFKGVNLKTLKQKEFEGNNLKSFQVSCEKMPIAKPAEKKAKKEA